METDMKKTMIAGMLALVMAAPAQAAEPWTDLMDWGKKQEIRTGGAIDASLKKWGATYWVPASYGSRGWGSGKKKGRAYVDALVGIAYAKGRKPKYLAGTQFHPVNLGKWAFSKLPDRGKLAKDRFKIAKAPAKLSVGPAAAFGQHDLENMWHGRWKALKGRDILTVVFTYKFGGAK